MKSSLPILIASIVFTSVLARASTDSWTNYSDDRPSQRGGGGGGGEGGGVSGSEPGSSAQYSNLDQVVDAVKNVDGWTEWDGNAGFNPETSQMMRILTKDTNVDESTHLNRFAIAFDPNLKVHNNFLAFSTTFPTKSGEKMLLTNVRGFENFIVFEYSKRSIDRELQNKIVMYVPERNITDSHLLPRIVPTLVFERGGVVDAPQNIAVDILTRYYNLDARDGRVLAVKNLRMSGKDRVAIGKSAKIIVATVGGQPSRIWPPPAREY